MLQTTDCFFQPLLQAVFWIIAKGFGFRNICQAVPYIPRSRLLVNWLNISPHNASNKPCQLIYGDTLASGNIEYADGATFSGCDICLNNIPEKGEVPGLFAIAEDDRGLSSRSPLDEARDDGSILGVRVLPGSVDIEIPEADGGKPVDLVEYLEVIFAAASLVTA